MEITFAQNKGEIQMEQKVKRQSPFHDYSNSLYVMQLLGSWSARYKYDAEDLFIALKSAQSLPIAAAFAPLARVKLDSQFIKEAEAAVRCLKKFHTFDFEFVIKRLIRARELDIEYNGQVYPRVFTSDLI